MVRSRHDIFGFHLPDVLNCRAQRVGRVCALRFYDKHSVPLCSCYSSVERCHQGSGGNCFPWRRPRTKRSVASCSDTSFNRFIDYIADRFTCINIECDSFSILHAFAIVFAKCLYFSWTFSICHGVIEYYQGSNFIANAFRYTSWNGASNDHVLAHSPRYIFSYNYTVANVFCDGNYDSYADTVTYYAGFSEHERYRHPIGRLCKPGRVNG